MKRILNIIEIRREEVPLTIKFGLVAFLLGVFLTLFDILSHSHFLEYFSLKKLSIAYALSGILGVILLYIYSLPSKKISIKIQSLVIFTFFLLLGAYLFGLIYWAMAWYIFLGIILFVPANTLGLLFIFKLNQKFYRPNQGKRIWPVIRFMVTAGLVVGGITILIGYYLANIRALLLIGLASIAAAWIFQLAIFLKVKIHKEQESSLQHIPVSRNIFVMFTTKFTRYILLFSLLSATIGVCIHYIFINAAWAGFNNYIGFSKFYGLFIAVMAFFIFGFQRILLKRILYSYDSPYSLILIPLLVLAISVVSIATHLFFVNRETHEHFTVFFLMLAITEVTYLALQATIQLPSLKTIFEVIDIRFRNAAIPHIEGIAVMAGVFGGSSIIYISYQFNMYTPTHILWIISFLCLLLIWVAYLMIKSYKALTTQQLHRMRFQHSEMHESTTFQEKLWKILIGSDIRIVLEALKLSKMVHPLNYESDLIRTLRHPDPKVRLLILKLLDENYVVQVLPELEKLLKTEKDSILKQTLSDIIEKFKDLNHSNFTNDEINEKLITGNLQERVQLALCLGNIKTAERNSLLATLGKDSEPEVQKAAIRTMALSGGGGQFAYTLIEYLYPDNFNPYAINAIIESGNHTLEYLKKEVLQPNLDSKVVARIMRILCKIASAEAFELILSLITEQDRYVREHSVKALVDARYQATAQSKFKILNLIIQHVSIMSFNFDLLFKIQNKRKYSTLCEAVEFEIENNYEYLFNLLALIYNPSSIHELQRMFLNGSSAQVSQAIEMADEYIQTDINSLIFPLLEDITLAERIKKLQHYFPEIKISKDDILTTIVTHDYNLISHYTKACAMMIIAKEAKKDLLPELEFSTYHSNALISQTAQYALSVLDSNFKSPVSNNNDLILVKLTELRKYKAFTGLSEFAQIKLTENVIKIELSENASVEVNELMNNNAIFLTDIVNFQGYKDFVVRSGQFVILSLLKSFEVEKIFAIRNSVIWAFSKEVIPELLFDNSDFANEVLESINSINTSDSVL